MDEGAALPSVWLQELTWQEVEAHLAVDDVALVPIGSTEQHGPAGCLGVDTLVAITLAEDAAQRTGAVCAPPLWYGDSSHHGGFAGTLSLRPDTLILVVRDICRSLAKHGFRKIILLNGHKGSNLPALTSAVRVLHEEELPDVLFAVADPLHLGRSTVPTIKETNEHHGGELELSHVHARFPGSIRTDRLTGDGVDFDHVFGGFVGDDLFGPAPDGVEVIWSGAEQRRFAPSGSFSSSLGLSAEKGQSYHDVIVRRLCEFIEWARTGTSPIGAGSDQP